MPKKLAWPKETKSVAHQPSLPSDSTPKRPVSLPASPSHKKVKKTISEVNKAYDETKRVRLFQESWKKNFPWLLHENGEMKCAVCLEFPQISDPANPFVLGCTTMRRTTVASHSNNARHRRCLEAAQAKRRPGAAPMNRLMDKIPEHVEEKLRKLFRTAYYIGSEGRPFTEFSSLIALQNLNGASLGETYANPHKCKEFLESFNSIYKERLNAALSNASFFSILCDGSTDSGVHTFVQLV